MLNRVETAVVRESVILRENRILRATGAKRRGTVYSPAHGQIIGFNFGTSIRPEVAPIKVNTIGDETIESYLARGGRILKGAPKTAKGALIVNIMPSGTTRVVTSRG
jgi:hypothetical protein